MGDKTNYEKALDLAVKADEELRARGVCGRCGYELADGEFHTIDNSGHQPPDCQVHFRRAGRDAR